MEIESNMIKNNRLLLNLILLITLLLRSHQAVFAQSEDYALHLKRNFGYGGGSNIRGTFTLSLVGGRGGEEDPIESVTFLIDGETMTVITAPPYTFKFQTDDYGFGTHILSAEVLLDDQTTLTTSALTYRFISPKDERQQVTTILGGIIGAIIVVMVLVSLIQSRLLKKGPAPHRPGQPRNYGMLGGTICPKCGQPFPRHVWGINIVVGRLDRCENCGKWVITHRATPAALKAGEGLEETNNQPEEPTAPDVSDGIEESKYIDQI
jgi:hypothetical protein